MPSKKVAATITSICLALLCVWVGFEQQLVLWITDALDEVGRTGGAGR